MFVEQRPRSAVEIAFPGSRTVLIPSYYLLDGGTFAGRLLLTNNGSQRLVRCGVHTSGSEVQLAFDLPPASAGEQPEHGQLAIFVDTLAAPQIRRVLWNPKLVGQGMRPAAQIVEWPEGQPYPGLQREKFFEAAVRSEREIEDAVRAFADAPVDQQRDVVAAAPRYFVAVSDGLVHEFAPAAYCVLQELYRDTPPLDRKGWQQLATPRRRKHLAALTQRKWKALEELSSEQGQAFRAWLKRFREAPTGRLPIQFLLLRKQASQP